jgi:predicted enzyme related to lactoylglutathione lyase
MSARNGFQPGVPCWVATVHREPEKAALFYAELFGWEAEDVMPPGSPSRYFICRLRGRDVAAVGSAPPGGTTPVAVWNTHIWVESADDTVARVIDAGGSVITQPFDLADAARMAVLADPAGAVFCVWQPREHQGAQLVNEPGAWSMSDVNTPDLEGSKTFYGAVFGWRIEILDLGDFEYTMWLVQGYEGGEPEQPVSREVVGGMMPLSGEQPPGLGPHWGVDFWVDDVDETAGKTVELGGNVIAAPFDIPVGRTAVLADPQGAAFAVSKVAAAG